MKAFLKAGWGGLVAALVASVGVLGGASAALAAPSNDDFAQARSLRVGTTVKGSITGATKQRGEPRHANSLAKHSVWYRFRTRRKRAIALSTCRASFDSVVAVYTGRSLRALREVEFNNDGCVRSGGGSRVTFTARPGRTYRIAVAGFTRRGSFPLKTTRVAVPPNDDFADAAPIRLGTTIASTTANATRELREPDHAPGVAEPRTVWFRLTVASASTVRLNACNGSFPNLAVYTGGRLDRLTRLRVNYPDNLYDFCAAQFAAQPGVTYRIAFFNYFGGGFRLAARVANPPANDNFADATPITLGATINGTTRDATSEPGETDGRNGVWYRLALAEPTTIQIDNCTSYPPNGVQAFGIFRGAQVDQLTLVITPYPSCSPSDSTNDVQLDPGVYSIRATWPGDFSFRIQAVAPPP